MADGFDTDGMLDMYLFENGQLLERIQQIVLEQKNEECFDEESINEIFRAMHTIKGSSGIMMFDDITAVAHKLEDVFFYLRESHPTNVPHVDLVEHVLEVADFITSEMDKIESGGTADGDSKEIIASLDEFLNSIQDDGKEKVIKENVHKEPEQFYIAPAPSGSHYFRIHLTYTPEIQLANIHAYKIVYALKDITEDIVYSPEDIVSNEESDEEILKNGFEILLQTQGTEEAIRDIIQPGYELQKVDITPCSQKEFMKGFNREEQVEIDLDASVEEIEARQKKGDNEAQKEAKRPIMPGDFVVESKELGKAKKLVKDNKPKKADKDKAAFITVDVKKMDMLMDLIGELVISESVVLQNPDLKVPGLKLDNFNKAAGQMAKTLTDLQNVIMSMRMMPLANTFQKMNRIVFDVSRKLGKEIDFEMIGENTEVDKNIIEHISDPLMHLVRNSVDHGIETKEERIAHGKTEKGKVTLVAKTEAGKVWISVQDNGTGLDREKILAKARKQGLLDPNKEDSDYSDKEVYQFITLPGFSTNEQVTEYSGRGVGMDVVVSNIQAIGGTLEIESTPGQGSSMNLKIPLTLAIIDGIIMEVGGISFVMEASVVKEFISIRECRMVDQPDGSNFVMIRGECYPVLCLGDWYHLENYQLNAESAMLVILEVEGRKICILVDKLIGKQEIVVKPIPDYVKKVKGLSGCTQLGDGSIALILDATGLCEH